MRLFFHSLFLVCLLSSYSAFADTTTHVRVDLSKEVWHLHTDMTYEVEMTTQLSLLTPYAVSEFSTQGESFSPDAERLELVEAYVIKTDGAKIKLGPDHIKTRPSPLMLNSAGFANSNVTTVVFPELEPGSKTFLHWKKTHFKPETYRGLNIIDLPNFEAEVVRQEVIIHKPNDLVLNWKKVGSYQTEVEKAQGESIIHAWIENKAAQISESQMPSPFDFQPLFFASTTKNWEEIGSKYYDLSEAQVKITPEIQRLALQVVGDKKGLEAARALYDWTAQNIHYISLGLNDAAAYTPHSAETVLKNRYGDCKDYAILLQSLLKAVHIKSYTALIDWGTVFKDLPVPTPFQFNHAIIYLPDYQLFANPTSRTTSFGVLDPDLSNKLVVIASEKGEVARTPASNPLKNSYRLNSQISLKENGDIDGSNVAYFYGDLNNHIRAIDQSTSLKTVAEGLLAETPEAGTGELSVSDPHDLDKNMVIQAKWSSPSVYTMNELVYFSVPYGVDYFSPRKLLENSTYGARLYPAFTGAKTVDWDYELSFPPAYSVKALPKDVTFKNSAGSYQSHYQPNKTGVKITRQLIVSKSYYEPEEYQALNQLRFTAARDGRSIIVLNKDGAN